MTTLANLSARLDRVEEKMEQAAPLGRCHLLFVRPGENEGEAVSRQKRELCVADGDDVIVLCLVAPHGVVAKEP